jgi:uncharacterized protein YvpB
MRRILAIGLALLTLLSTASSTAAGGEVRALPVPYRSQLDGNPYQDADCGPASMGMILAAYGQPLPTITIREFINELQGTQGNYDSGSFFESLWDVAGHYGLQPDGLFAGARGEPGKTPLRRWTMAEVRGQLDAGHPIVTQVWYRGLPGRETRPYNGDHYMVVIGYTADDVIYNDPIDKDGPGASRRMTWAQFDKAWRNSDFPYAGMSIGGSKARPSLLTRPVPAPTATPSRPGALRPFGPVRALPAPAPGDMPLAGYPGTWNADIAGAE